MKPWTEARNNDKYMKSHSNSHFKMSRETDYHARGKWFIYGAKHHKENQLLSLKHSVDYP